MSPFMNLLREMSSFDSGFFTGAPGRPGEGEEIEGRATAAAEETAGPIAAGVPAVGLVPTGEPIVGRGVAPVTGGFAAA